MFFFLWKLASKKTKQTHINDSSILVKLLTEQGFSFPDESDKPNEIGQFMYTTGKNVSLHITFS